VPARRLGTGDRVDGFTVGEAVHTGAMSTLFAVSGPGDGPSLLMKVPRLDGGDPGESLVAFETEVTILRVLSGPHAPRFVGAGDLVEAPYLIMERILGENGQALVERGRCPVDELAAIGAAVADALADIHTQGVIHLDLKPENLIRRANGEVVLLDFGLAHSDRHPDLLAEETRYQAGSAPYLSPEQVRGDRSDRRSDLFALGAILYELAVGEPPFGTPVARASLGDRLWRVPTPPRALRPDVPEWLQEVILRCLEVEAGERYQSAAHVAFDLRHPEQVAITSRGRRHRAEGFWAQARRWWRARQPPSSPGATVPATPVVMVAVDTTRPDDPRQPALQASTRRLLSTFAEVRLICAAVVPEDHLDHLARLRRWVRPLGMAEHGQTLHVIQGDSPTETILELARANHVDLLILGAPDPEQHGFAWWRSVASGVAARAPCTVHLVRVSGHH
jgi:serine/threonine protein kinase